VTPAERLFIGVGNPLRGDDAAGLLAARWVRERLDDGVEVLEMEGEPIDLIEAWRGAEHVLLADAVASGGEPGEVHRVDVAAGPVPARLAGPSTHALGLAEAIELGRALESLPPRLILYGIEAARFEVGAECDPVVLAAVERVAAAAQEELGGPG
jgi:hydrogenase maturation protease